MLLAAVLIVSVGSSFAQEYEYELYDVDDGLASSWVSDLCEDSLGHLMLATTQGVFRFDGYRFQKVKSMPGAKSNWSWLLGKSPASKHWTITGAPELFEVSRYKLSPHKANDTLYKMFGNQYKHTSIGFLDGDTILIGFAGKSYYAKVAPEGNVTKVELKNDFGYNETRLLKTATGFTTTSYGHPGPKGEALIRIGNKLIHCTKKTKPGRSLYAPLQDGKLITNGRDAFIVCDDTVYKHVVFRREAICLEVDQYNNIWVGLDKGGVEKWNPDMSERLIATLGDERCYSIIEDREGTMWFATKNGVYRVIESAFTLYNEFEGGQLACPDPPNFLAANSALWIETRKGVVSYQSQELQKLDAHPISDLSYAVNTKGFILVDRGGIYQHSGNQLYRISPKGFYRSTLIESDSFFWTFQGSNLLRIGPEQKVLFSARDDFEEWPRPTDMATYGEIYFRDADNYLWLAIGSYLYRFNGKTIQKVTQELDGIELRYITDAKLINGVVWVSSTFGLWAMFNNEWQFWSKELQASRCESIVFESDSSLWVTSTKGLTRIRFSVRGGKLTSEIKKVSRLHGLKTNSVDGGIKYDNAIWFSTKYGASKLDVEAWINRKQVPPIMKIRGLYDELTGLVSEANPRFGYDHNNLAIHFIGISHTGRERPTYKYRLLGADTNWHSIQDTVVQFSGLLPNDYRFEVKTRSALGIWSKSSASVSFSIAPPFWKTWWFITCAIIILQLIVGGGIVSIHRNKRRALLSEKDALEAELKAIRMQVNPHFMYNALNNIREMVTLGDQEKAPDQILKFSRLMRKILNATREKYISLADEVDVLRAYLEFAKARFEGKVDYSIEVDPEVSEMMEVLNFPPLLTQPIVENAIIHGASKAESKGRVGISIRKIDDYIHLQIIDNGPGMKSGKDQSTKNHRSQGMNIIEEQINKLNTTLKNKIRMDFASGNNGFSRGTSITIQIPVELH